MKRALFFILSLVSSTALAAPTHIYNIQGYTLNDNNELSRFSNIVFDGGKVIALGNEEAARAYPQAQAIDGKSRVLMPGLIDAHGHILGLGGTCLLYTSPSPRD